MADRLSLDEMKNLIAQYSELERFELADFCLTGSRVHTGYAWDFLSIDRLPVTMAEAMILHSRNMAFILLLSERIGLATHTIFKEKMARGEYGSLRQTYVDLDFVYARNLGEFSEVPMEALAGTPEGQGVIRAAQQDFQPPALVVLPAGTKPEGGRGG